MTVKINLECDGFGCGNSTEINGITDGDIAGAGYSPDPEHGEYHYCPTCWPPVKAKYEAEVQQWQKK